MSIPTIKFYIREGLLPRGARSAPNQAAYSDAHLERLALIAALQRAGLSLDVIGRALRAMDDMLGDTPDFMAIAVESLEPYRRSALTLDPQAPESQEAHAMLRTLARRRGWQVDEGVPAWADTVRALAAILHAWELPLPATLLERYASVAEELAAFELPETWQPAASPSTALRYVVLGTILFEPLILALRRLAHIDRGHRLRAARGATSAPALEQTDVSGHE